MFSSISLILVSPSIQMVRKLILGLHSVIKSLSNCKATCVIEETDDVILVITMTNTMLWYIYAVACFIKQECISKLLLYHFEACKTCPKTRHLIRHVLPLAQELTFIARYKAKC